MSDYIPPYPPRHAHEISPWRRIAMARENLLSAFEDGLYELDFVTRKIGFKHFFLCNSPETIQAAFGTAASTFERKGPTQRQMLRPILGDGLFVSEAETWRKRRRMVAPVIHLNRLSEFAPFMTEAALEMAGRWGEKQDGATTDVLRDMAQLTAEIICRTIFGGALGREAMVDDKIAGHKIPKGSLLFVVPWLVHRNRKLWDKPDHFIPERFLPGNPAPSKWTYLPFSMGPRICAGMAFGLTEAILCLATLAQQFKLRLSEGHKMEPICRVSLRPGEELPMTLHRRRPPPKPGDAPSPTALKCPVAHA